MAGSPEKCCITTCLQVEESAEIYPLDLSVVMFSFLVSSLSVEGQEVKKPSGWMINCDSQFDWINELLGHSGDPSSL